MIGPGTNLRRFRSRSVSLILVALLALIVRGSWAELKGPATGDRNVTKSVTALLKNEHLTRHPLDDEISGRLLKIFTKMLDPMKLYFYQSDIDSFNALESKLDDQIAEGDISFGYKVFNTLLERIDERVKLVDELLAMNHDFTVDEEMITDRDAAQYPRNEAEARERWRKRIKYDLLVLKADGRKKANPAKPEASPQAPNPDDDPLARLARRYHSFARRMHQTDRDELLEMYLTSLTTAYDPHTSYMSPGTLENFEIMMRLNLDGIGAQLSAVDGYTEVTKIIPGGAADRAGELKASDRIVGVAQGDAQMVDTVDMKLSDVVDMIRGKRGTVVRLEVLPAGQTERKIYSITRDRIDLTDEEARSKVIEQDRDGAQYKVGVIDLPSFYMDMDGAKRGVPEFKSTTRDVAKLLEGFRKQHVDAVILDLRRNGGGSLTEAISLTGLFIDQGPIVQVKDKNNRQQHYDDQEEGTAWDGPLVVLTSKFSASASEIFAGAIQDYGRGVIVGDTTTHGKGTVQSLLDLGQQLFRGVPNAPSLGALKITMQKFYRPNGDSTQNRGVLADIVLPSLTNELKGISEADLDHALDFDRIDAVEFEKAAMVDNEVISRLSSLSRDRQQQSQEFQTLLRKIERYREWKNRKSVTLHEEKFFAEQAELTAEDEVAEKELDNSTSRDVFDTKNYYNQEALAITLDYLRLANLAQVN